MRTPSPKATLTILWGTAVVVLVGGFLLARQQHEERVTRDRRPLEGFVAEARTQLQRLDDLHRDHLMRLGRDLPADVRSAANMADGLVGVLQVSLLPASKTGSEPFHAAVNASPDGPVPLPAISLPGESDIDAGSFVLLDESRLFIHESLWIDEPGKPLMFCVKRSASEVAVITLDRPAVAKAIAGWLEAWAKTAFEPVRVTSGPDRFQMGERILAEVGVVPASPPDLLIPLRARSGVFEIASWDQRRTVVHYHPAALTLSGALAVVIGVLGFLVFDAQRRDRMVAEQRVSFVNRVSHELRSPLTNILLNVDLASELAEDDPEECVRRLDLVRTEGHRLSRLITNVLTFARVEEGKYAPQVAPCVPADIINGAIDSFVASFASRGVTIVREQENVEGVYGCDGDALAQIVGNLLSNVEKYAPNGTVRISSRMEDGQLIVRVCDDGPGIPPEAAERIFQPFERVHSDVKEGVAGTGLGLAIARDLARRLGGDLLLVPAQQEAGACFELRLPVTSFNRTNP